MKHHWFGRNQFLSTVVLLAAALSAGGADVEFFGVVKLQRFEQVHPAAPMLAVDSGEDEGPAFAFNTFVDLASSNAVTNATVTLPGGGMRPLALEDEGFVRDFSDGAEFKSDLDTNYPNGTYTVFLQTRHDGDKTISLTLPATDAYPNPPRISNFGAARTINAGANFTLTWDAFAGGLATDFLFVELEDIATGMLVFETAGPGEPGSLNGTSTSVLIPAGTLLPGRWYRGNLLFARIVDFDDTSYGSGVTGVAAFVCETRFVARTTGGTDLLPPFLEAYTPFNMQTDVPGSAVVAFRFNERMNTTLSPASSVGWSNLDAGQVGYTWSADGRTLFCVYPPGLPLHTVVNWQLNPAGSPLNLRDQAGNVLATQGGSFQTGSATGLGVTDLRFMGLVKGRLFRQTASTAEDLQRYQFALTSDLNTLNGVTNGLLTLPNGRTATPELSQGDALDFEAEYSSPSQVDLFFPEGDYVVRLDTVRDGTRTFHLNLGGVAYPNAPQIVNFASTQSVNPTNAFVLSWNAFAGGTVNDFIMVEIYTEDEFSGGVFETPDVGQPGALNGTNTSVIIPGFTLAPGRRYRGEVLFAKLGQLDTTTYPGAMAVSGRFSVTTFELQTIGTPIQPSLQIAAQPNNSVRVTVTGERNRFYTLESTDDLAGGAVFWLPRASGVANAGATGFTASFQFDDGLWSPGGRRFYRAREGSAFGGGP